MQIYESSKEKYKNAIIKATKNLTPELYLMVLSVLNTNESKDILKKILLNIDRWDLLENDKKYFKELFFDIVKIRAQFRPPQIIGETNEKYNERVKNILLKDEDRTDILYELLQNSYKELINKNMSKSKLSVKSNNQLLNSNWLYFIVFGLILIIVVYIVLIGWAQKPSINIEFNIGDIIGGILIGSGALLAGRAYAKKNRIEEDQEQIDKTMKE